ncbi:hypothetical protein ABL78_3380 [Leptomonas seymouri]|uniref:Sec16 Sec23-binding domain-containing protein n=1 Tax=Leptomonas seymouri TaxID=5684 RepID=A0A0N0P6T3_LEPSE|nr:hypothetical protein ABL78_3380 [Leptomonas seymouri]|eukprot:KPI87537.1 hypothetical protein ABL78_3380 [Leptomonas seymouri]
MSSGPPPPPTRPVAAGNRAGAPHPASMFGSRLPGGVGAPMPSAAAKTDPAVRRANMLSVYNQYANPMANAGPTATSSSSPALPPNASRPAGSAPPPPALPPPTDAIMTSPPPPPPPPSQLPTPAGAVGGSRGYPPLQPSVAAQSREALLPPPPPPGKTVSKHTPPAGPRYAVPDFALGGIQDKAQPRREQQQQQQHGGMDSAPMPPPPSATSTLPTAARAPSNCQTSPTEYSGAASQSTIEQRSEGQYVSAADASPPPPVPPAPPHSLTSPPGSAWTNSSVPPPSPQVSTQSPAPTPSSPMTNAGSALPLATRVSGAALRSAASLRNSSNGNGSRSSSHHSQRDRHSTQGDGEQQQGVAAAIKDPLSLFTSPMPTRSSRSQAVEARTTPTAPAVPKRSNIYNTDGSRPTSRDSSLAAHTASAATATAGSRGASSAAAQLLNKAAAFHRDIPSFLKPSGGAGGLLLSRHGRGAPATVAAVDAGRDTHAPSARGLELLEAALRSRGSRDANPRGSDVAQRAAAAESSPASPQLNGKSGKGASGGGLTLEVKRLAAPEADGAVGAAPVDDARQDDGALGKHARTFTGDYSTASLSYRAADASDCNSPLVRVPPLQRSQLPENFEQRNIRERGLPSFLSHELNSMELIAGEVDASTNEVSDIAHRYTPRSGALEPLPTPADETSQNHFKASPSLLPQSAATALLAADKADVNKKTSAASPDDNPFLESDADEAEAFFGAGGPLSDTPLLPEQPPQLPRPAQSTGMPTVLTSSLMTLAADAAPTSAFNPFADALEASDSHAGIPLAPPPLPKKLQSQQQQRPSIKAPPAAVAAPPLQPPPLPPLPQQRPAAPNGVVPASTNSDYNTPRGGAAGGTVLEQHQQRASQPTTGLPLPLSSADSATRGPYAASPYIREVEDTRAMAEESPLPLRPPLFNSMPQWDGEEAREQEQMQVAPTQERDDDTFFGTSSQQHQQQTYGANDEPSCVTRPHTWDPANYGASEDAERPGEGEKGHLTGYDDQLMDARCQTHQPYLMAATTTSGAPADQLSHSASPLLPQQRAVAAAAADTTDLCAVQRPHAHAESMPPATQLSPPPALSSSSAIHNRGAANPLPLRRSDACAGHVDDIRRQHQGQQQSRVQTAQRSTSGSAAAASAMVRGCPQRSPNEEEPANRLFEGFSKNTTPFLYNCSGGSDTVAQAVPPPTTLPPPREQQPPGDSPLSDRTEHDGLFQPTASSAANPFLVPDDGALLQPGSRAAALTEMDSSHLLIPPCNAASSFRSLPQQQTPSNALSTSLEPFSSSLNPKPDQLPSTIRPINGAAPLGLTDDDFNAHGNNNISASGPLTGVIAQTPGGSMLVNPFSKAARSNMVSAAADASGACNTGSQSSVVSLANSFVGRRKARRISAPCFAIFVGGATVGVPGSEAGKGTSCIAACFNNPRALSPTANSAAQNIGNNGNDCATAGRTHSPSLHATPGGAGPPPATSFRPPQPHASSRSGGANSSSRSACVVKGANNSGGNSNNISSSGDAYLSFCSVAEALTAKGSVVDRKGVRGTESGRQYVRALRDVVLPCALAANEWAANGPRWSEMAEAMRALEGCVPAPLASVLMIILKDAMKEETQESFVWKDNGGRRLGELLFQTAQAESRKYATTATNDQGNAALVTAFNASPLNIAADSGLTADVVAKERSAALLKVEDLLCTGQRVEAVKVALDARLYVHALIISMMCPTKDDYLCTVRAITQKELMQHSPLAHAYSMFNELPLPPLLPPPLPSSASARGGEEDSGHANDAAEQDPRRARELMLRDQSTLKSTWLRHAAVLLANFTRESGGGLLNLAGKLQQLHLVVEAHTCLLLLHLTPLGMAAPVRAGAQPLPPVSAMSAEEIEDVLPRPDQRQVMEEIRRRIGVVGGIYHPTQGCRASFLTPLTTLLTQLLQLVREQLNARAPPLEVPGLVGQPVPFHGLPGCPLRTDVGYRMMQVLWLREVGLLRESRQALSALLQRMPPPAAFSLYAPPRTLNDLVYLFGGIPPPESLGAESTALPPDVATAKRLPDTEPPSATASTALEARPVKAEQLGSNGAVPRGSCDASESLPASTDDRTAGQLPLPPPPRAEKQMQLPPTQQEQVGSAPPRPLPLQQRQKHAPLPEPSTQPSPPQSATSLSLPTKPNNNSGDSNNSNKTTPKPAAKPAAKPASRRSRSIEALRNLFFRRGKSESEGGEKTEEAKPMHLDTEKPPEYDPVTGRWMFPETEEERKLRELTKQGPPKMVPKAAAAESAGAVAPAQHAGDTTGSKLSSPLSAAGGGVKRPPGQSGTHPLPTHGAPAPKFAPGRGAPPPMMAGRDGGVRRPGGRQQYVDMFNNTG